MLKKKIPNETISSTLHRWSVPAPCNGCVPDGGLFPRSWSRCYTPIFISTFCRFRVSSAVMNWSGVSDDPLFTKCTISWDLLASPLSPLGFLSSMVPFPLLITSFFFCPHLRIEKKIVREMGTVILSSLSQLMPPSLWFMIIWVYFILLTLKNWHFSEQSPWTSSQSITCKLVRNANSQALLRHPESENSRSGDQGLGFSKPSQATWSESENQWSQLWEVRAHCIPHHS